MKKVLLSLSALVAATVVSASTLVPIYGGGATNTSDSVNSANGFANFTPPVGQSVPAGFTNTEVTETNGNIYLRLTGSSANYYVWGTNNGKYSSTGTPQAFGYTGAATGYVSFRARAGNANSRMKVGLQTTDGKTFAAEIDLGANAAALTGWVVQNLAFNTMRQEDANGNASTTPNTYPTAADLANVAQINIILQVNSCQWDPTANGGAGACINVSRSGEIWVDDIYLSQNSLTTITQIPNTPLSTKAAANIASSVVFPNPASDAVFATLNLKASNDVTVVVTDLMGRQVATRSFGRVTEINNAEIFNAASLAKGMYTVTYVLDGTPAKSDLVVVK